MGEETGSDEKRPAVPGGLGQSISRRVVFDGDDPERVFAQEVRSAKLTGFLRGHRTAPKCNIVESVLEDFDAESVDFSRCDFKDSAIRSSGFRGCHFGSSSFAYNAVEGSRFEECDFPDTDIHNCTFFDTAFLGCNFSNVLIKSCNFARCEFFDCRTSNKMFETSRFSDCDFRNTELQVQTIEENFGLVSSRYAGLLRGGRPGDVPRKYAAADLKAFLDEPFRHSLKKLNIDYFVHETFLDGSPFLDASVRIESWMPMFRTASSFVVVLGQWVEFILGLYTRDEVTTHTIACLHSMTGTLVDLLSEEGFHSQALSSITGAHMSLARAAEVYLYTLDQFDVAVGEELTLLVEGGDDYEYYYRDLAPLFERTQAIIARLAPHNSPWDLVVSFVGNPDHFLFVALLLATRLRFELFRLGERVRAEQKQLPAAGGGSIRKAIRGKEASTKGDTVVEINLGVHRPMPENPTLRLKFYVPGDLVAELKLDVGSQAIAKIRKTVRDIL